MPTRTATQERITPSLIQTTWTGLLVTDDGSWVANDGHPDRTFQVLGTFGGATLRMEGTNEATPGAAVFTLTDQVGGPLAFTAAGGRVAAEAPRWVRPFVVGGDGTTALTVVAVSRG